MERRRRTLLKGRKPQPIPVNATKAKQGPDTSVTRGESMARTFKSNYGPDNLEYVFGVMRRGREVGLPDYFPREASINLEGDYLTELVAILRFTDGSSLRFIADPENLNNTRVDEGVLIPPQTARRGGRAVFLWPAGIL